MIVFERGHVFVSVRTGKCEACGDVDRGLCFTGAADSALLICARCLAELQFAALPALAQELARWGRDRSKR